MALNDALQLLPWPLVLAGIGILVAVVMFRRRPDVMSGISMGKPELALLCLGPIAGLTANLPLSQNGNGILALNVGGAFVSLLIVGLWIRRGKLDLFLAVGGTLVVAVVAKIIVVFDPEQGIYTTFPQLFAPSLVALAYAMAVSVTRPLRAVPLAYAAGSMGSLLGADLLNLGPILEHLGTSREASVVCIGGAGVFDMVYLAGMVAMAAALLLVAAMLPRRLEAMIRYPPPLGPLPDPSILWQRYLLLRDPNPRERARGALALSDLHLARRDYAGSLRHSFLAVHAVLESQPQLLERLRRDAAPALLADLDALLAAERWMEAGLPVSRRLAGNANRAAKLALAAVEPLVPLPSRLDWRSGGAGVGR